MRFSEFKILTEAAKVGREYQHLEDLVFVDGSAGATKAVHILNKLGHDSKDIAIKWDGYPTMYWGRDNNGEFVLVGKNGWMKGNISKSAKELYSFITSTGKGEDWRERFAKEMATIFNIMEQSTPASFRGYVYGDLLYHPGKPFDTSDAGITFTPNQVTYTVDPNSELGKRMSNTTVGVVVHTKYAEFGDKSGQPISDVKDLNQGPALVLGQTYVTHTPEVDTSETKDILKLAQANGAAIDKFLAGAKGLSNPAGIIYTYVNQMSKGRKLDKLETGFFDWLKTSKVSTGQQARLADMHQENPKALPSMFGLVKRIMAAKDHIIQQLDDAPADVKQSTNGEQGGEGYVALGSKTKLVPRTRWTPS